MLGAKQELVDAVKLGLGANTEQLRQVGAAADVIVLRGGPSCACVPCCQHPTQQAQQAGAALP